MIEEQLKECEDPEERAILEAHLQVWKKALENSVGKM
jgi:hypothetical protein